MVGEGLEVIVQNGRDREMFVSVLKSARQLIEDHRGTIQSKISKEIPISGEMLKALPFGKDLVGPFLDQVRDSIASAVAGKTIEKVQAARLETPTTRQPYFSRLRRANASIEPPKISRTTPHWMLIF